MDPRGRDVIGSIIDTVKSVADSQGYSEDSYEVSVPQWIWNDVLYPIEREEELINGWLIVEVSESMEADRFHVNCVEPNGDALVAQIQVPGIVAMSMAVGDSLDES